MSNNTNNNISNIKYDSLEAMKVEYSYLSKEEKKKYMNMLTEWYMREKDILRNVTN
jgi:hypothetical protein